MGNGVCMCNGSAKEGVMYSGRARKEEWEVTRKEGNINTV